MATRIYSAGQLDQRVQFQARAPGSSPMGTPTGAWANEGTKVWAAVRPLRGDERNAAMANVKAGTMTIFVRHSAARPAERIKADGLRLVWNGQILEIVDALRVDGGSEFIEIYAKSAAVTA